jgi:hypothetical protein
VSRSITTQDELFAVEQYHAVFTDSPFELIQAEEQQRDHAIVEQVFADLSDGPLTYLPPEAFAANAAWRACAAITHNLVRAADALSSLAYGKARGATIRRGLIDVAARPPNTAAATLPSTFPRLASRARMDQPIHSGLRTACSCGQTNPRTGHRTLRLHGPQPSHPIRNPDKPQE